MLKVSLLCGLVVLPADLLLLSEQILYGSFGLVFSLQRTNEVLPLIDLCIDVSLAFPILAFDHLMGPLGLVVMVEFPSVEVLLLPIELFFFKVGLSFVPM